jgi:hypothetical protein
MLWFNRNKAIHDGIIPDSLKLASSIKKAAQDHAAAWLSVPTPEVQVWIPPKKAPSKSTLTRLLENTSQLKQLFAETTLAPYFKLFLRYLLPALQTMVKLKELF